MAAKAKKKNTNAKNVTIGDPNEMKGELKTIGGSMFDDWNNVLVNQVTRSLWVNNSDEQSHEKQLNAAIAALACSEPKSELESMVIAQLIASHNAAMECYRRAMIGEQTFEGRKENLNQANKLSRTWTTLLEALNRHRGKGQQKVTVEHVNVHSGGQAIVGAVESPRGGGSAAKNEDQPHAEQISHAPQPAMPRADAEREPVPIAGDEERAMPDARRKINRSAEGQ